MENVTGNNVAQVAWYSKGALQHVDSWFLMGAPWPVLAIWLAYLAFVLKIGPAYMAKRPAFQLKTPLVFYNLFQIGLSCYIVYLGTYCMYHWGLISPYCAIEGGESQRVIIHGVYVYLLAKISELLDTVFFVLRKKMNQVSFLHVYHHSMMMLSTWFSLKYNPTDALVFLGTLNSFVHVIMYGYYGLSAFPSMTKYLWWKKYITAFQLIQFGLIILQVTIGSFVSSCQTSYILLFDIIFNSSLMVYLFSDFYVKAYGKKETANKNGKTKTVLENDKKFENGNVASIINNNTASLRKVKSKGI